MDKVLVVDRKFAHHLNIAEGYLTLFPGHEEDCPWLIPQTQYSKITTEIISLSNILSEHFAKDYYAPHLKYKHEALLCLFNGFGGLVTFFVADRLIRINKWMKIIGNKNFHLPPAKLNYDSKWSHAHLFYNLIEQSPEFNQWAINEIFSDLVIAEKDLKKEEASHSLYFETHLPKNDKRRIKASILIRIKKKIWDGSNSGLDRITLISFSRSVLKYWSQKLMLKMRGYRYTLSSFGKDIPWDGLGPIPDPHYDKWSFMWPTGRLCYYGQDSVTDKEVNVSPDMNRDEILKFSELTADLFNKLLVSIDGECLIEKKYLLNIIKIYKHLAPRCFVEDVKTHTQAFVEKFRPFSGRTYFAGGTFAAYPGSLRVFACRELDIDVISTQHSAWGGYFANGPLVTEFLIKGSDKYITFGWDQKPSDGSGWKKAPILLSAPLTSRMYCQRKPFKKNAFHKRVLLCPGFIYRFPSIYNSALRVDNMKVWSAIIKDTVDKLSASGIEVDILMYNNVMAGNMKDCLDHWLEGNHLAHEYEDHDVKVRYILNGPEFKAKYDAVVWDLLAGGFVESVSTDIPTFALWNEKIHLSTKEGKPYIESLQKEGILFHNGETLVHSLQSFYQNPEHFIYKNNSELRKFFDGFVKIKEDWLSEWNSFFESL